MFLKYSFSETCKNIFGRLVLLEELQAASNFSKVSLHLNKITNSLGEVLQTYSQICFFVCAPKKVFQKHSAKIDLKVLGKSCGEIDYDVMKFML